MEHTPFFLNGLLESNCLIIYFRSPRLGSSKSILAASGFDMFTSMEATCLNGYAMKILDQHCGVNKGNFKFANQNKTLKTKIRTITQWSQNNLETFCGKTFMYNYGYSLPLLCCVPIGCITSTQIQYHHIEQSLLIKNHMFI